MYEPNAEMITLCEKPDDWYCPREYKVESGEWERWGYTYSKNRDSDILTVSNYETIKDDMLERFPDDVMVIPSSHWLCGWIDQLWIRHYNDNGPTKAHYAIMEWKAKLDSYPVSDESDFCQREYDNQIEYLTAHQSLTESQAKSVYGWLSYNGIEWYDDNTWVEDKYVDKAKDALFIDAMDRTEIDIAEWVKIFLDTIIADNQQMRFV